MPSWQMYKVILLDLGASLVNFGGKKSRQESGGLAIEREVRKNEFKNLYSTKIKVHRDYHYSNIWITSNLLRKSILIMRQKIF